MKNIVIASIAAIGSIIVASINKLTDERERDLRIEKLCLENAKLRRELETYECT